MFKILTVFNVLCAISLSLSLVGCSQQKKPTVASYPGDDASIKLAEAADSVSRSLLELARIQTVATPPTGKPPVDTDKSQIRGIASVDWAGPIGPLAQRLANAANYRLRVLGSPPPVPVLVKVSAKNTPLADIIRDVDFQAGSKAGLRIYDQSRVIELRYDKA